MITVIHIGFIGGRWLLWGEKAGEEKVTVRRGRRPKRQRAEHLPYDAFYDMSGVLQVLALEKKETLKNSLPAMVWLPTALDCPSGSTLLVSNPLPAGEAITLRAWKISTISLSAGEIVSFLTACLGQRTLAPGIILGADITYWTQVLRFAGSLVSREKYLPGICRKATGYYAQWEPLITGDDLKTFRVLSEAMPAVCRALSTEENEPPAASSLLLLSNCLTDLVDAVVRIGAGSEQKIKQDSFDSTHEQWIYALKAQEGLMKGPGDELVMFAAQVKEWQRKLLLLAGSSFKLCLRLEEPEAGSREWSVNYYLQSVEDPSLVIPVKDAWQARGKLAQLFKEQKVSVPELVLSSLGQAAGIYPVIEDSLKTKIPSGWKLDTEGAYKLLTETAPLLEQAGFTIQVPSWWTKKGVGTGLTAAARVKSQALPSTGGLTLDSVIAFDWEISLGGEILSKAELESLAKIKVKLVKLRGQWVEVDADKIQAILKNYRDGARMTARDLLRLSIGGQSAPGDLEFEGVKASGWMAELLDSLEGRTPWQEVSPPSGLAGQLRPYQQKGYSWLHFLTGWGFGACLADDMGLGKTIQTLSLVQRYREEGEKRPVLLICPTSLVGNWQREANRFTPDLPVLVHYGGSRRKKASTFQKEVAGNGFVISSYSLLHRDFELFKGVDWAGVILDEAQNIKNPHTKQARAARALEAGYRVALTGTPVENNVGDLWSLFEYINPGLLGSQASFKSKFFIPIQVNRDSRTASSLKRLTNPFVLRRLKTDRSIISDLPDKMEMKVMCNLTKEQATLYAAIIKEVEESLMETEGIQRRGLVLATLTKLKQVCNHPAQFMQDGSSIYGRSGKLARLTEMCEEILSVGERTLIFTQFVEMGKMLQRHLIETFGREVLFLHGGLSKKERDRLVELFQNDKGPPFFILSLKAGGTGLNLTAANHVFHFDRWWNPAIENQATDRVFRIGQTKNVQVHKFVCAGTVEERIDEMIEKKKEVAGQVVGSGEGWLTELSTSELKEIWALSREAVGE